MGNSTAAAKGVRLNLRQKSNLSNSLLHWTNCHNRWKSHIGFYWETPRDSQSCQRKILNLRLTLSTSTYKCCTSNNLYFLEYIDQFHLSIPFCVWKMFYNRYQLHTQPMSAHLVDRFIHLGFHLRKERGLCTYLFAIYITIFRWDV